MKTLLKQKHWGNWLVLKTGWSNAQYIFVIHFLLDTNECERGIDKLGTPPLLWSRLHCYHSGKWFMKGEKLFSFGWKLFYKNFIQIWSFSLIKKCIFTWFIHRFNKPMKPQLAAMNWIYGSIGTRHLEISNLMLANVMSKKGTNLLDKKHLGQTMLDIWPTSVKLCD